jgi:hypothetical protein
MYARTVFKEKVKTLRSLENFCYQIAYYLLQDETLAVDAAKNALLDLGQKPEFFRMTSSVQQELTKKVTIRSSFQVKCNNSSND